MTEPRARDGSRQDRTSAPSTGRRPGRRPPAARRRSRRLPGWAVVPVVVAVLLAGEVGARIVGPNIPRTAGSEERAYIKADQIYRRGPGSVDLVILGSSETAGGLIPSAVLDEVPALSGGYNAALAGAQLDTTEEWARRIVLPGLRPDVVVLGLTPTLVGDFSKADFDPAEETGPAYRSAFDLIDPGGLGSLGWKLRQHSAVIRYRPYLRHPTLLAEGVRDTFTGGPDETTTEDSRMDWETEDDPKRVLALTEPDGEVLDYRDESIPGGEDRMSVVAFTAAGTLQPAFEGLEALVSTIRDAGAAPVLAIGPVDRSVLEAAGADLTGLDGLSAAIVSWGEANDVPVLDQFTAAYPPEDFHDRQHVDQEGAEAWSAALGRFLAERCDAGDLGDAC